MSPHFTVKEKKAGKLALIAFTIVALIISNLHPLKQSVSTFFSRALPLEILYLVQWSEKGFKTHIELIHFSMGFSWLFLQGMTYFENLWIFWINFSRKKFTSILLAKSYKNFILELQCHFHTAQTVSITFHFQWIIWKLLFPTQTTDTSEREWTQK